MVVAKFLTTIRILAAPLVATSSLLLITPSLFAETPENEVSLPDVQTLISDYLGRADTDFLPDLTGSTKIVSSADIVDAIFKLPKAEYVQALQTIEGQSQDHHALRAMKLADQLQTVWEAKYGDQYYSHFIYDLPEEQKNMLAVGLIASTIACMVHPEKIPQRMAFFRQAIPYAGAVLTPGFEIGGRVVSDVKFVRKQALERIPPAPAHLLSLGFVASSEELKLQLALDDLFSQSTGAVASSTAVIALQKIASLSSRGTQATLLGGRLVKQLLIGAVVFLAVENASEAAANEWSYHDHAKAFVRVLDSTKPLSPPSEDSVGRLGQAAKNFAQYLTLPTHENLQQLLGQFELARMDYETLQWQKEVLGYELQLDSLSLVSPRSVANPSANIRKIEISNQRLERARQQMNAKIAELDAKLRSTFLASLVDSGDRRTSLHYLEPDPQLVPGRSTLATTLGPACQFKYEKYLALEALVKGDPIHTRATLNGFLVDYSRRLPEIFERQWAAQQTQPVNWGHFSPEEIRSVQAQLKVFYQQKLATFRSELIQDFLAGTHQQGLSSCRNPLLFMLQTRLYLESLNTPVSRFMAAEFHRLVTNQSTVFFR